MLQQSPPAETHWYDTAIEKGKFISEALDVFKVWGAYIAEWVLLICLFFNILEMFPIISPAMQTVILAVQSITLDIAGFGLTNMGAAARRNGNAKAANTATAMGWALIGLMILTVVLVTLPIIWPVTKTIVDDSEKVMILLRVIVTVFYGHIVHSVRAANKSYVKEQADLGKEVSTLKEKVETQTVQLQQKTKEMDSLRGQLQQRGQEVSTLNEHLEETRRELSTLQDALSTDQRDAATIRKQLQVALSDVNALNGQIEGLERERTSLNEMLKSGHSRQSSVVSTIQQELDDALKSASELRRQASAYQLTIDNEQARGKALQSQLDTLKRELEEEREARQNGQTEVSTLRQRLSTLQQKIESGQQEIRGVSSVHSDKRSTRNEKIVPLVDVSRPRKTEREIEESIRELLLNDPTLSGRALASQVQCSPTTANKWKALIEEEQQATVNE